MAAKFEKGKHIFFLFKNGRTVQDSQLSPRYYLERSRAEQHLPYGDEIVEYAPVVHGEWKFCGADRWNDAYQCSECGKIATDDSNYCLNCGAKMDGGTHETD